MEKLATESSNWVFEQLKGHNWENPHYYSNYLAQTYYYVCHSTRLLGLGASLFGQNEEGHHRRYLSHTGEEGGHHLLALNDLKNMGRKIEDFEEMPETCQFYETQYFKILFKDPLALMGYIISLETIATIAGPWMYQQACKTHGENTATFLKVHSEEDFDHIEKAFKLIESASKDRLEIIEQNIKQSALGFMNLLNSIQKQCNEGENPSFLKAS